MPLEAKKSNGKEAAEHVSEYEEFAMATKQLLQRIAWLRRVVPAGKEAGAITRNTSSSQKNWHKESRSLDQQTRPGLIILFLYELLEKNGVLLIVPT